MTTRRSLNSCSCGEEGYDEGWGDGYQEGLAKGREQAWHDPGELPHESYAERHWVTPREIDELRAEIARNRAARKAAREARRLPPYVSTRLRAGMAVGMTDTWAEAMRRAQAAASQSGIRHRVRQATVPKGHWVYAYVKREE